MAPCHLCPTEPSTLQPTLQSSDLPIYKTLDRIWRDVWIRTETTRKITSQLSLRGHHRANQVVGRKTGTLGWRNYRTEKASALRVSWACARRSRSQGVCRPRFKTAEAQDRTVGFWWSSHGSKSAGHCEAHCVSDSLASRLSWIEVKMGYHTQAHGIRLTLRQHIPQKKISLF